jgi:hypothetical protein
MMRSGVRDLGTLTAGIDPNSAAIIEVLLGMVEKKERSMRQGSGAEAAHHQDSAHTATYSDAKDTVLSPTASSEAALGPSITVKSASLSEFSTGCSELSRQPSHGTKARGELISLRQRLLHSYKDILKVLETLLKLLTNITKEPTARKFRSLRVENPLVKEAILDQVEVVDILKSIGFEMKGDVFELDLVDRDCLNRIHRVIKVLQEEIQEVHEEWSSLYS